MRFAAALLLSLSLLACQKQGYKSEKPRQGPPQPDDVVAVASVRSLRDSAGRLRNYLDAVRPGLGAAVPQFAPLALARMIGANSIEGIALDQPLHVIVLDPKKHPRPLLLLARGDAAKLRPGETIAVVGQDGAALLGDKAAVELCAAWAFGSLSTQAAPASPTIRASLRKLVERYRSEIERGKRSMGEAISRPSPAMAKLVQVEIDLLLRLASQTEEMRAVVDASATEAWFELGFTPTPGSNFEVFNKVQRPASAALLSRLPGAPGSAMLLTGHYEMGPVRDLMFELMREMIPSWSSSEADDSLRRRWDDLVGHFRGPVAAITTQGPGLTGSMQTLYAVDDGPKTIAALKALFSWTRPTMMDLFGMMKVQTTPREAVARHDGVTIDEMAIRFDLSTLPPAEQQILRQAYGEEMRILTAGFDNHVAMTWGPTALADMQQTIDRVRRGPDAALPPGGKAALDAAMARKASYIVFTNMAASLAAVTGRAVPAGSGFTMELDFPDGNAAMRLGMPAAHARDLVTAFSP